MNKPQNMANDDRGQERPVFVSFSSVNEKKALELCKRLEQRGTPCWISCRDIAPGENYQESIVRAIVSAKAMVLVFSKAANSSDEIKKELSLASRHRIPVIAVRIENVQPTDAFAYELSTRQWIDSFSDRQKAIDAIERSLDQIGQGKAQASAFQASPARAKPLSRGVVTLAASVTLLLVAAVVAWLLLRPSNVSAHSLMVRFAGFERLSPDLPSGMPGAIRDEIISAFNDDGVVGMSAASEPPPGTAPAYALGGTIRRDRDKIRVTARLTDERSGFLLWSNTFAYDSKNKDDVPRWLAVDAGNLIRCGLFGASTYPGPLPDSALADYLGYCHNDGYVEFQPDKAIYLAQKAVAAVPDFSWGWSAIAMTASDAIRQLNPANASRLRSQGLEAAAKAIRIDPANSEALTYKSLLIDSADLTGRETLLKRALQSKPLACGCEHHYYGLMLEEVGRIGDALEQYYRASAVQALNPYPQFSLGLTLLAAGKPDEAKMHINATNDLMRYPWWRSKATLETAPFSGDYSAAAMAVRDPAIPLKDEVRKALAAAFVAMATKDSRARSAAAAQLARLQPQSASRLTAAMLGALGADGAALEQVEAAAAVGKPGARGWLFLPTTAGAIRHPSFPGVAQRLGLVRYWRATHTKPDVCSSKDPPPFCRLI